MEFSREQQTIINQYEGQQLVVACPGSGKTTVLLNRIHRMINDRIPESQINIITYTKEAALEMKSRYETLFGSTRIYFGTIHAMCYSIIAKELNFNASAILKNAEKRQILQTYEESLFRRKLSIQEEDEVLSYISLCKNMDVTFDRHVPKSMKMEKEMYVRLCRCYEAQKDEMGKLDFDDMILKCKDLLIQNPKILKKWREKTEYLLVDEYQDVNILQAKIIYLLAGKNGNLCVVGDDDQSIYGFRGADPAIMKKFPCVYKNANILPLSVNYRCGSRIVEAADNLIRNNPIRFDKQFIANRKETGNITAIYCFSGKEQCQYVVEKIKEILASDSSQTIAVLYRNNIQCRLLSKHLSTEQLPFYTTEGAADIHQDMIYKDIMAYYRMSQGFYQRGDYLLTLNHPSRYLKTSYFKNTEPNIKTALSVAYEKIKEPWAITSVNDYFYCLDQLKMKSNPKEFLDFMFDTMGYQDWVISYTYGGRDPAASAMICSSLYAEASQFQTFKEWISYVNAESDETSSKEREGICLSTYHSSKGLEWDNVFLIDSNEEYTPSKNGTDIEEERRLYYVAMTRARNNLFITATADKPVSRFINEAGLSMQIPGSINKNDRTFAPVIL